MTWGIVKILVVNLHLDLMPAALPPPPKGREVDRREDLLAWNREYREKGRVWRGAAAKLPDLPAGSRVLELGCGNGKTLPAMLRRSWRIAALDISTLALRLGRDLAEEAFCRRDPDRRDPSTTFGPPAPLEPPSRRESSNHRHHPVGPDFVAADAVQLPFRERAFDAFIAFHVLGHLRDGDRRRAAGDTARVLKAGGRLFFLEFGVDDMRAGKGEEVEEMTFRRGGGVTTHYFSEGEVIELLDILRLASIRTDRRLTRIRGVDHHRSEVAAEFIKLDD